MEVRWVLVVAVASATVAAPVTGALTETVEPWSMAYGRSVSETFHDAVVVDDGIVAAGSASLFSGVRDVWVAEVGADGRVDDQVTVGPEAFPGAEMATGRGVAALGDGVVVAGTLRADGADGLLVRVDDRTRVVDQTAVDGGGRDTLSDVAATADGAVAVGSTGPPVRTPASQAVSTRDAWIVRLDGDGAVASTRTVGSPLADEHARAVTVAEDGDLVVAGYRVEPQSARLRPWMARIADDGVDWYRVYDDVTPLLAQTPAADVTATDDGFAFVGTTSAGTGSDALVVEVGPDGQTRMRRAVGSSSGDQGVAVAADGDRLLIGGRTGDDDRLDAWLAELGPSGTVRWSTTLGVPAAVSGDRDGVRALTVEDGRPLALGTTADGSYADAWAAWTDEQGRVAANTAAGGFRVEDAGMVSTPVPPASTPSIAVDVAATTPAVHDPGLAVVDPAGDLVYERHTGPSGVLGTPGNVSAAMEVAGVGNDEIVEVEWTYDGSDADGFTVWRSHDDGPWTRLARRDRSVSTPRFSYTVLDSFVDDGETYRYRVQAVSDDGYGRDSTVAEVTVPAD